MSALTKTMFLQVGQRRYSVATFEQASQMFCAARDKLMLEQGSSKISSQMIVDEHGETIGHVSYNGCVWPGSPLAWAPGSVPLYDNRVS